MERFISIALVSLFAFTYPSFAAPNPSGISDDMCYSNTDAFGDILYTIPYPNPGPSNAWVGISYANGEILQFKNVASPTSAQMLRINPNTGAVIATVTLAFPTAGYMMEGTWDGMYLYCCQWYPSGAIQKMTMSGAYVTTITPAITGSPRGIVYDGTNLWVGANVGSNVTNLYKMTTAGSILQSWATNSVVGWYMGFDLASRAPVGGQLIVVDNVGNTIKRLLISGTTVSIVNQDASPAVSPDVAEGLGYTSNMMIHCGAYASLGVAWFLEDGGVYPLLLDVNTSPVSPPVVIPPGGGSFPYNINIHNLGISNVTFQLWNKVRDTAGIYYIVFGPITRSLMGGANPTRVLTQTIASTIPSGTLYFITYVGGYYPLASIADSSYFTITKNPTGAGPWISESYVTGDLNFDETSVAAPTQFALNGNYPNPFNPTTNISYSLATASNVKLTIFDATGREVATLVNGYRDAGSHQVTFDASKLASGVYPYQLNSAGQVATSKMVLLK